jgi:hypothetical protein
MNELDVEVVAPRERWLAIRNDERFVELMRLARIANSLGICVLPLTHTLSDLSPSARRNRFAAFCYAGALLKEGLDLAQSLGKWFREWEQYKAGFGVLIADNQVRELKAKVLDVLRNKLVFHFDRDALSAAFAAFPTHGDVRILSFPLEVGPRFDATYFDAADDAVLAYFFGHAQDDEEYYKIVGGFMESVADINSRFIIASHNLVARGLIELGCRKQTVTRPAYEADGAP